MRRFIVAERDVVCSKMMPSGKGANSANDTDSLRLLDAASTGSGVFEYELPILKVSRSYTFTIFDPASSVKKHSHDEAQLRIITSGRFNFMAEKTPFDNLEDGDWIYLPKKTPYSIDCPEGGAVITGYGMSCKCSAGSGRRFLFGERDVLCSQMMPSGKQATSVNSTDSLRLIPALSAVTGVQKYEIPLLHESTRLCISVFSSGAKQISNRNENAQLRIITKGQFNFVVDGQRFNGLEERDWIYIPHNANYSIESAPDGELVTAYAMD